MQQHSGKRITMQTTGRTDKKRLAREERMRRRETMHELGTVVVAFLSGPATPRLGRVLPCVEAIGSSDRRYKVTYTDARQKLQALRSLVLARPDMHIFVVSMSTEVLLSHDLVPRRIYQLQNLWTARVYVMSANESASWLVRRLGCGKIYDLDNGATHLLVEPFELYTVCDKTYLAPCRQLLEAREQIEQMALHSGEPLWLRIRVFNAIERRVAALGGRVHPKWEHDRRTRLRGSVAGMMRSRWPSAYLTFGKPVRLHCRRRED